MGSPSNGLSFIYSPEKTGWCANTQLGTTKNDNFLEKMTVFEKIGKSVNFTPKNGWKSVIFVIFAIFYIFLRKMLFSNKNPNIFKFVPSLRIMAYIVYWDGTPYRYTSLVEGRKKTLVKMSKEWVHQQAVFDSDGKIVGEIKRTATRDEWSVRVGNKYSRYTLKKDGSLGAKLN